MVAELQADPAHVREYLRVYAGAHALAAYDAQMKDLRAVRVLLRALVKHAAPAGRHFELAVSGSGENFAVYFDDDEDPIGKSTGGDGMSAIVSASTSLLAEDTSLGDGL